MGMFDYINVEMDCPYCGSSVNEFQSKDYNCTLSTIDPIYVHRFYTCCSNCGSLISFINGSKPESEPKRRKAFSREEVEELGFTLSVD